MRNLFLFSIAIFLWFWIAESLPGTETSGKDGAKELVGLWEAKRRFGPDIRGRMILRKVNGALEVEVAGVSSRVKTVGNAISFELSGDRGRFEGKYDVGRTTISGHWIQPKLVESGLPYASPVKLKRIGPAHWQGEVEPFDDVITFFLVVKTLADDAVGAFLCNPERNLGRFIRVERIEKEGDRISLVSGGTGGERRIWAEGEYRGDVLIINFPNRGGSYDFKRVGATALSNFYPRGRPNATYVYAPPPKMDDGWETGSLEDVGISRVAITKFIQMLIDTPISSVSSQQDHGVLIARHGKLVLEEYFHGEHREKAHDTRSASKSVAADLIGAAMYAGVPIHTSVPVYKVMNGGEFSPDLDPGRRAMTLEHLLTMTSGLDCDDNDPSSLGYEDRMWEQSEDFYKWTMNLKMVRQPGEKGVYCSASPNLAGGVLYRISKKSGPILFQNLLAEPLQIKRYYLPISPHGQYTMTGGARFLPRDFMKLAQVHLNGGSWKGRRVFTADWSRRATTAQSALSPYKLNYGYLWWVIEYPFKGRTIRAYFASGNGGQVAMAVPDLDLVLGFYGGNYSDVGGRTAREVYVPKYIIPAVEK